MILYRLVMAALAPILIGLTAMQWLRGRVASRAIAQRLGFGTQRPTAQACWLHGASNGELTSAEPLLRALLAARPGLQVLVTANTGTAVAMVRGWGLPGVQAALSPLDSLGAPGRVLRRWRPVLLIVVENELWPARLAAAAAAGVPVALIGARMSAGSARNWARLAPGLMRAALARLSFVSAQDTASAARLRDLGLPADRIGPEVMLKAGVSQSATPLPQIVPRDRVVLAASTHPGEEALIVRAFQDARNRFDLLIIAPRHPRRSAEVAGVIAAAGLTFLRRSDGAEPATGVPVYLADTMGEMALWYAMAGVTVIGGSFVPLGGHTPYEPCAAGSAIVHGPHMENFAEPATALARAGGAVTATRGELCEVLAGLDAERQAALARAARQALPADTGLETLLARLLAFMPCGVQPPSPPSG